MVYCDAKCAQLKTLNVSNLIPTQSVDRLLVRFFKVKTDTVFGKA